MIPRTAAAARPSTTVTLLALLVTFVVAAALLLTGIVGADAKPGNGNGKNADRTPATLTASPNPVQAGGVEYVIQGCGFDPSTNVDFVVHSDTYMNFWPVGVDANGCIHDTKRSDVAGTYLIEAYQDLKGRKPTLVASTELHVID